MSRFIPSGHPFADINVGQLVWLENDNYGNPRRYWRPVTHVSNSGRVYFTEENREGEFSFDPLSGKCQAKPYLTILRPVSDQESEEMKARKDRKLQAKQEWKDYRDKVQAKAFHLLSALKWYVQNDVTDVSDPENFDYIVGKRWAQQLINEVSGKLPTGILARGDRDPSQELYTEIKQELRLDMLDGHNLPTVISEDLLNAQLGQEFLLAQECTSRGTRYHVLKVTLISPSGLLFFTNEPMPSPSLGFHPTTGKSVGRAKWTAIRRATAEDIERKAKNRAASGITPHMRTVYQQAAGKRAFMLLSALQWYVENDDVDEVDPDKAYWITGKRWAQTIIKAVNESTPASLIAEKKCLFSEELVEKLKAEMLRKRWGASDSKDPIVCVTAEEPVHAEAFPDFVERGAFV